MAIPSKPPSVAPHPRTEGGGRLRIALVAPPWIAVHGPFTPEVSAFFERHAAKTWLSALSQAQRRCGPQGLRWVGAIPNPIEVAAWPFEAGKRGYPAAFLMPIRWPEPFGMVMIEAMVCGTPVVAFRDGSVPEIVVDGETGFVVDDEDGMTSAVRRLGEIDPRRCREVVEERYSIGAVAAACESAYRRVIGAAAMAPSDDVNLT